MSNLNITIYKKLLVVILLLSFSFSKAQQTANSIEINLQKSISTFSANNNPLQGDAYGMEFIYHVSMANSTRQWARDLKLKSVDFIFNYKDMTQITRINNPIKGEYGDSYGLLVGLTKPVLKIDNVELDFNAAFGLVYAGQTWFTNQNPLIGSKLNTSAKAGLKLNVPVSSKTKLAANIDILHYSNGGTRVPNNGMNIANIGLGVATNIGAARPLENTSPIAENYKTHTFDLGIGAGRRGVWQSRDGLWRTALYGGYNYRLASYLALGAGVDAIYYHTIYDPNRQAETYQSNASSFKRWRVGAALGPDLWMGKVAIMAKYGYYVYYDSLKPIKTYWTAGGKYKLNDWLALQAKIYIHKTEADFVGFGLMFTK